MKSIMGRWVGALLLGAGVLFLSAGPALADDKLLHELKERLDRLEKQNDELRKQLQEGGATFAPYKPGESAAEKEERNKEKEKINTIIDSYLQDKEKKKKEEDKKKDAEKEAKAKEKEAEGFEVGKQVDLKGRWTNNQYW